MSSAREISAAPAAADAPPSEEVPARGRGARRASRALWALALAVPAVGVAELVTHVIQVRSTVSEAEWRAAGEVAKPLVGARDLVVFAPFWAEPLGRLAVGPEIATYPRVARPDSTAFPRAVELAIRGARNEDTRGWKVVSEQRVGKVTVRVLENPSPATVRESFVERAAAGRLEVSAARSGGASEPCPFERGRSQTGYFFFGPPIPADRFVCRATGTFVGASVAPVGEQFEPKYCVYVPTVPGGVVQVRIPGARFGNSLRGYHATAMYDRKPAPVTIVFRALGAPAGDRELGRATLRLDEGWKPFELDTRELDGREADLVAEITSADSRQYCFHADTR